MPFKCYLCNEEYVLTSYFCDDCNYIKRILQCYGKNEIKDYAYIPVKHLEFVSDKIKSKVK